VLKPKLKKAVLDTYPKVLWKEILSNEALEYTAQQRVFSVPTVIILADGKEVTRFVRAFSASEVLEAIQRPYKMMYEE
jgi:thioredoxin-like negative regulator of GroEL